MKDRLSREVNRFGLVVIEATSSASSAAALVSVRQVAAIESLRRGRVMSLGMIGIGYAESHQDVVGPEERHQRIASIGGFAAKHRVRDGPAPASPRTCASGRIMASGNGTTRDRGPTSALRRLNSSRILRLVEQAGGVFHFRRTGELSRRPGPSPSRFDSLNSAPM